MGNIGHRKKVTVQIPESMQLAWDWDQWVYDPSSGQVINVYDRELILHNYIVFSVSRYNELQLES